MTDAPRIEIRATTLLKKFAEGADPDVDEPLEVIQDSKVLTDQEVQNLIDAGMLSPGQIEEAPQKTTKR